MLANGNADEQVASHAVESAYQEFTLILTQEDVSVAYLSRVVYSLNESKCSEGGKQSFLRVRESLSQFTDYLEFLKRVNTLIKLVNQERVKIQFIGLLWVELLNARL